MGLSPIYQRPRTSDPHPPEHRIYPYLLATWRSRGRTTCGARTSPTMRRGRRSDPCRTRKQLAPPSASAAVGNRRWMRSSCGPWERGGLGHGRTRESTTVRWADAARMQSRSSRFPRGTETAPRRIHRGFRRGAGEASSAVAPEIMVGRVARDMAVPAGWRAVARDEGGRRGSRRAGRNRYPNGPRPATGSVERSGIARWSRNYSPRTFASLLLETSHHRSAVRLGSLHDRSCPRQRDPRPHHSGGGRSRRR